MARSLLRAIEPDEESCKWP